MTKKWAGDDPSIPLEVMAFIAAIQAGEVEHHTDKCLVPGCPEYPGHDMDGSQFTYCSRHNAMMHLDYEVDISGVPFADDWKRY